MNSLQRSTKKEKQLFKASLSVIRTEEPNPKVEIPEIIDPGSKETPLSLGVRYIIDDAERKVNELMLKRSVFRDDKEREVLEKMASNYRKGIKDILKCFNSKLKTDY